MMMTMLHLLVGRLLKSVAAVNVYCLTFDAFQIIHIHTTVINSGCAHTTQNWGWLWL